MKSSMCPRLRVFRSQRFWPIIMKRIGSRGAALGVAMALTILVGPGSALAADAPVGKWKTVDEKSGQVTSEVELYEQGGKLFGKIIGLPEPNDAQGKPKTCTKCQGANKDKPIVGLVIVKDLAPSVDRSSSGRILDPEDGKVYKAEI